MGAVAAATLPEKMANKAIAIEDSDNSGDDATEEDVEGEEPVCHTYKNKNARLELCEVELDEYMSDVSTLKDHKLRRRVAAGIDPTHYLLTNHGLACIIHSCP